MKKVIALGFFDGVHLGHGALLRRTVERAKELGAKSAAFTFETPPGSLISGKKVQLLTTVSDREDLMRRLYGVEELVAVPFDRQMMTMKWDKFVTEFLVKEQNAVHLVAGHDYRFGYQGEGTPERLMAICQDLGLGCDIVKKVELEGRTVSSTYIRSLVERGDMDRACRYLGHPHQIRGRVAHGKGLGSKLGFPTVNIGLAPGLMVPAHGVYASKVYVNPGETGEKCYLAATNVGTRPSVADGREVSVESFLLDFQGDLYGQELRLELYHRLRWERPFDSLEELRREVMKNAQETRDFFA